MTTKDLYDVLISTAVAFGILFVVLGVTMFWHVIAGWGRRNKKLDR